MTIILVILRALRNAQTPSGLWRRSSPPMLGVRRECVQPAPLAAGKNTGGSPSGFLPTSAMLVSQSGAERPTGAEKEEDEGVPRVRALSARPLRAPIARPECVHEAHGSPRPSELSTQCVGGPRGEKGCKALPEAETGSRANSPFVERQRRAPAESISQLPHTGSQCQMRRIAFRASAQTRTRQPSCWPIRGAAGSPSNLWYTSVTKVNAITAPVGR